MAPQEKPDYDTPMDYFARQWKNPTDWVTRHTQFFDGKHLLEKH